MSPVTYKACNELNNFDVKLNVNIRNDVLRMCLVKLEQRAMYQFYTLQVLNY